MEDPASVGIRFLLYLDLMLLFGLSMFGLYGLHGPERSDRSILKLRFGLILLAVLGIFLSAVALFLLTASMAGLPLTEVDAESVTMLLSGTSAGAAWTARVVALAIAFLLPLLVWRRPFSALTGTSAAGATALGTLAWTGHGAAGEGAGAWLHLIADIAHLFASGIWLGALAALGMLAFRRGMDLAHAELTRRALEDFSPLGSWAVAILVITGLVNSWFLIGISNIGQMVSALYGQLLAAKLVLFLGMLGLAALNRFRLTPGAELAIRRRDISAAVAALRCSLLAETSLAVLILALVAWLGMLSPPAAGL